MPDLHLPLVNEVLIFNYDSLANYLSAYQYRDSYENNSNLLIHIR